eukprot:scaffold38871_cov34-Attheya_sp.AAC.2
MTLAEWDYWKTFEKWFCLVGQDSSVFLVDGVVSFTPHDVQGVKFVNARSSSCGIGRMENDQNRFDCWLDGWLQVELLSYGKKVGIADGKNIIDDNMFHLGGAKALLKLVRNSLWAKYNQQKIVDILITCKPPADRTGVYGTTFSFASEFVASRVSMALCLMTEIKTAELLCTLEGIFSMRGVLFEAYAARKIAEGGDFRVKEIGSSTETMLTLAVTTVFQTDTKNPNKTHYPPNEIEGKLVWPNPAYNMPAIEMFMFS